MIDYIGIGEIRRLVRAAGTGEFIARLAPQLDRRDVRRAFDHGIAMDDWPEPPRWRDLGPARLAA